MVVNYLCLSTISACLCLLFVVNLPMKSVGADGGGKWCAEAAARLTWKTIDVMTAGLFALTLGLSVHAPMRNKSSKRIAIIAWG